MKNLQSTFIAGPLPKVSPNVLGGNLPFVDHFIENLERGIGAFLSIGLHKILAHIVQFHLAHIAIRLYDQGSQRKQVELKIGGRNRLLMGCKNRSPARLYRKIVEKTTNNESYYGSRK